MSSLDAFLLTKLIEMDLENTKNELVKVSQQLAFVTRDLDGTTIKVSRVFVPKMAIN